MEEAKIQAWVNLEKAKAEAESRKLEVKTFLELFMEIICMCSTSDMGKWFAFCR